ncbi:hypothetical protein DIU31_030635 [Mucilaginibacter rubeus]|uniref:Uncharacterized protein n=1 Tax=Mucilaginibacter rubeus TaxID=2027860 RepID=A0AAE6JLB9_9SPHI|nr:MULTISPECIES: hypothetical protein [Mucilaginibacter]QEM07645.1 hypothetical protein DIU31_030635 [Mucilaginibacter rubeus]QEM20100.1 hypothetical protein DIU38_030240 [Mucilaginibacter gossypii]QTE43189.1 hypothetical protein J3L19_30425 [Mucilaginibacter rubeus]QTE49789.1 hypothetical protein J3L21_30380 [Mucilaginibacter rubeus]QTE54882.1 hypothetical protein J3L23_22000 [Mucilaginibacter rubeus]
MEFFSINAFYLGVFISTIASTTTLCYGLICMIWKIKIIEVSQFGDAWFSIFKDKIFGIDFKLGWLPFGSSVRPLGYLDDVEERNKINPSDIPNAVFSKPKYVKQLINFTPLLLYIVSFFVVINLSKFDLLADTSTIFNFAWKTTKEIFYSNSHRAEFVLYAKSVLLDRNHILFSFLVADILFAAISIPTVLMNLLYASNKLSEKAKERLQILSFLPLIWLLFWEIPKFIFSIFGFKKSLIYIFSCSLGAFALGVVFFFMIIFVLKSIERNLQYNTYKKDDK